MSDLKPCPFCGCEEIGHVAHGGIAHVCMKCGARGPDYAYGDPEQEEVWTMAARLWNERNGEKT